MFNINHFEKYFKIFKVTLLSILFISIYVTSAFCQKSLSNAPVARQAKKVANLFRAHPQKILSEGYEELFTQKFLKSITKFKLTAIFTRFFLKYGSVTRIEPRKIKSPSSGSFYLIFEKGYRVPIKKLIVTKKPPHRISTLIIGSAESLKHQLTSLNELIEKFRSLSGVASFYLAKIREGGKLKPIVKYNANETLAIGSAFKLYVLGTLVRAIYQGQRSWKNIVILGKRDKSLPTGLLQNWPDGSPLTLHTLAVLMISQSDNTAADLLIHTLGRKSVEKIQKIMGHSQPSLNKPFLTTREMFVLKTDSTLRTEYLHASLEKQRALLVNKISPSSLHGFSMWSNPNYIHSIEWFASTHDLAEAMAWFKQDTKASKMARKILSINSGLRFSGNKWNYIGYKGGSEPGVINMTYLLKSKQGNWYVFSASWNNFKKVVDKSKFFTIIKQTISLIE